MLKVIKESTEEQMISQEQADLEGEFYYMSTRYKSLIPLINEVKALRGEIEHYKGTLGNVVTAVEKIQNNNQKQNKK